MNTLKRNYSNIKKGTAQLRYIMNSHVALTNPNVRVRRVSKKKRNLTRNVYVAQLKVNIVCIYCLCVCIYCSCVYTI